MDCVIPAAPCLRRGRTGFLALALALALLLPGCHYGKAERKGGSEALVDGRAQSPVARPNPAAEQTDAAKDDPSALDEDSEADWVPIDGSEKVIVSDLPMLTDGMPVRMAPATNAAGTADTKPHGRQ